MPYFVIMFVVQLRQQQQQLSNQPQGMVRTQMLTTVKGNIVQQIPLQQAAQAQIQQQSQQQQQQQPQPTIMQTAQGQQLVNATILTNANGGQPVTVWQRRTDQGIFFSLL